MRIPGLAVLMLLSAQVSAAKEVSVPAEPGALARAIETAAPGDVLVLEQGDHAGPVIIDRALTLKGDGARIVGPGAGTVISIEADDVTVSGLEITGSGKKLNELDSGIAIAKGFRRAVVEGNRLTGNLIGVDVQGGRDAVVRGNTIIGRDDLRRPEMGPGIYVWNAPGLLSRGMMCPAAATAFSLPRRTRRPIAATCCTICASPSISMYSNNLTVHDNRSHDNDMGFAFMYSTKLDVRGICLKTTGGTGSS